MAFFPPPLFHVAMFVSPAARNVCPAGGSVTPTPGASSVRIGSGSEAQGRQSGTGSDRQARGIEVGGPRCAPRRLTPRYAGLAFGDCLGVAAQIRFCVGQRPGPPGLGSTMQNARGRRSAPLDGALDVGDSDSTRNSGPAAWVTCSAWSALAAATRFLRGRVPNEVRVVGHFPGRRGPPVAGSPCRRPSCTAGMRNSGCTPSEVGGRDGPAVEEAGAPLAEVGMLGRSGPMTDLGRTKATRLQRREG